MDAQFLIELALAGTALALLALGMYRTWQDPYRRPVATWGVLAFSGLTIASALALIGGLLLLVGRLREPAPWRLTDWTHYERRRTPRGNDTALGSLGKG